MIQTAGGNATNYVTRIGYGDFPVNTGDWTILLRFKIPAMPTDVVNLFVMFDGPRDFTGPFLTFETDTPGTNDLVVAVNNGGGNVFPGAFTQVPGTQYWLAITYTASTTTLEAILDGVSLGTGVCDLSAVVWDSFFLLGDEVEVTNAASVAYFRAWNRKLSGVELTAEAAALTAVSTTNLVWDNPLQASIDLTAHNNTLNQLMASGTITTDTDDPLLSVVAYPPTNTTPLLATVLTDPGMIFQDTIAATIHTKPWYAYTALADGVFSAIAFGALGGFNPTVTAYDGLTNAQLPLSIVSSLDNLAIQFPVVAGHTYYFQVFHNAAVPVASTLQFSVSVGLEVSVPAGSFGINDDFPGFQTAFLSRAVQGYPLHFVIGSVVGEGGDILPSGRLLLTDDDDTGAQIALYDSVAGTSPLVLVQTIAIDGYSRVSSDQQNTFYIGASATGPSLHAQITTVSGDGVLGPTTWTLPQTGMQALGVNAAGTIAYYASGPTSPIRRFDLVNNVALTDLAPLLVATAVCKDIIVLADDTILVMYVQSGPDDTFIRRYATDGTLLQTYDLGSNSKSVDNRMARDPSALFIWAWLRTQVPDGFSSFVQIQLSDGATPETTEGQAVEYEHGRYFAARSNTPVRHGHSESCPFWLVRSGALPAEPLRLTQLPLEVAYDYAMLQRFVKGNGRNWITPPPTGT